MVDQDSLNFKISEVPRLRCLAADLVEGHQKLTLKHCETSVAFGHTLLAKAVGLLSQARMFVLMLCLYI